MCQMLFVFHHPLNPRAVGPPCEGCYGQHEKMRDCWPPPSSTEAQLKNYPPLRLLQRLLLHLTTQTRLTHSHSDRISRCCQRGNSWPLAARSNRSVHDLCAQVHMCVFIMFYACIWTIKRLLGKVKLFYFPLTLLVSRTFPLSRRCYKASVPLLAPHLSQVYSLLTTSRGIVPRSGLCSVIHFFPSSLFPTLLSFFPRSSSVGISSASTHLCVYAPAVLPTES